MRGCCGHSCCGESGPASVQGASWGAGPRAQAEHAISRGGPWPGLTAFDVPVKSFVLIQLKCVHIIIVSQAQSTFKIFYK